MKQPKRMKNRKSVTKRIYPAFALLVLGCAALLRAVEAEPTTTGEESHCGLSSAKGSFGFVETGTIIGFGSYAATGTLIADGAGKMTGTFAESANGVITSGITFNGTYTVNADCTGTAELTDSLGRKGTRAFVIVQQGKEFSYLFTDAGFVATGIAKKQ